MKKSILIICLLMLVFTGCSSNKVEISEASSDFLVYTSVDDLENSSSAIVTVEPTGTTEHLDYYDSTGTVKILTLTKTTVKITEVFKGNIKENSFVNIYEPANWENNGLFVTTEGYNLMKKDGKYLLFLTNADLENEYIPRGGHQGKFDLNAGLVNDNIHNASTNEKLKSEYFGDDVERFNKLKSEAIKKYKKVN